LSAIVAKISRAIFFAHLPRDRHDAMVPVRVTLERSSYSGVLNDNSARSHSCRKMVGIAGQGDLIADYDIV
jgi:hypothetical protein